MFQEFDAKAKLLVEERPGVCTLNIENYDMKSEGKALGFVRLQTRLRDLLLCATSEPLLIKVCLTLIAVACIGLLRQFCENAPRVPFVATLMLAKIFGRVLLVVDSRFQNGAALPTSVIDYGGKLTSAAQMWKFIIENLNNNNVLVCFHLVSTLAPLSLSFPNSRVVEFGSKLVF